MIKYLEFKIFAGKHLPPSSEIFVQKIPIQNSLLFVNRFFLLAAHVATN